jgi:lipopolysaccharide/colanic/teichoic acid biosynthesis glycosyltransferase
VTDPEARRYFMTIPEAVRLVLQCGAMGRGGEVFLLDMGEQVRIVDLARQLIRMAGLREGEDIEIVFTGLRPGEKLYEELHSDSERTRITRHERILVWELEPGDEASLLSRVDELEDAARRGDSMEIRARLHSLVPEYFEPLRAPDAAPPTPVVELPAAAVEAVVPGPRWGERMRELADGVIAGIVLLLSIPLWALLWIESRRAGLPSPLVEEIRIGRTRRHGPRREARTRVPIERRSIERRTRNLFGMPLSCLRFSRDLGPVSRWVARHRLDTIPYLFNVLRGEMALVGPKPAREDTVLRWCGMNPEYERRFTVQPGVTGLAQVSGCSEEDLDGLLRRAEYDLYYVQNRSLLLDVRTMVRTLRLVLGGGRKVARRPKAEVAPAAEPITNATQANGSRAGGLPSSAPPAVKGVTR